MTLYEYIARFFTDSDKLHNVVHGDASTTVTTDNGPVRSLAKLVADNQALIDAQAPSLAQLSTTSGAGLVAWIRNAIGAVGVTISKWLQWQTPSVFDFMTDAEIADVKAGTALLDVTAAVKKALASGPVKVFGGVYKLTDSVTATYPVHTDGTWPVFKFARSSAPTVRGALLFVDGNANVLGLTIDASGADQSEAGILIDASYYAGNAASHYDVRVNGVKNSDPTKPCRGFLYFVASNSTRTSVKSKIRAVVNGVVSTANGQIGDPAGSSSGVGMSINKTGMVNDVEFIECEASGVRPAEDGDGFNIYDIDYTSLASKSSYRLTRCRAKDNAKRGIKSTAPNCLIVDPEIDCDLTTSSASGMGIDCYGANNTVINPKVRASYDTEAICGRAANFKLINPDISTAGLGFPIRLDTACVNFSVLDGQVNTAANFPAANAGVIYVAVGSTGHIRAPLCINANSKGSVVALQGLAATDSVTIDIPKRSKAASLVYARSCVGKIEIQNATGDCTGNVVDLSGCHDVRIYRLAAKTTGLWAVSSPLSTVKMIGGGEVSGMTLGAVTAPAPVNGDLSVNGDGVQVVSGDWRFIGNAATVGVDVTSAVNPEVVGVFTSGFATHIKYNATTKAFIGNNRGRGAGAHLLGTGATGTITYNNNLIA